MGTQAFDKDENLKLNDSPTGLTELGMGMLDLGNTNIRLSQGTGTLGPEDLYD